MNVNSSMMGLFSLQVVVFCFLLSCSGFVIQPSHGGTTNLNKILHAELLAAGQRKVSRNVQSVGADVKQGLDFDCPEEFGYYPHPTDCTQYYVCVFGGALLESCTGGLMYSHELQTCDWPRNVGCDVAGEVPVAPVQASSAARSAPEPRSRYTVAPPPAPPAPAQPNPVVTSHGQPRQLHHHQDQQDYITKQQQQRQQQLYEEADESLPPVEEVETDRQQRVYRGQPSTVGQVQRDRDALRHTNAIPSPIREKISFGTQQQQPIQQYRETITPQHDHLDANIDDVLTKNLTQTTNRLKRQIRYRIRERIPKSRVKISWTSDSATPLTAVASNIRHIYVPSEVTNKHIASNVHHKQHHPVDLRSSVVKTFRPSVPINEQTSGGTFKPIVPNNPYHNLPIHTLLPIIHRSSFTTQQPSINGNYSVTPTGTFSYFNLNNNNNQEPLTRQTHNRPNDDSNFAYYYNVQPTAAQTSFNPIALTTGVPQIITQSYNDLRYVQNNPQQKYYNPIANVPTKVYPSALPIQNFSQPLYDNIYKLTPQENIYSNVKPIVEKINDQKTIPKHEQIPEESVDYPHDESTPIPEESKEHYNEDNEQKEEDYEEYDSKDGNNRYTDNEQRSEDDHETTTTESAFSHIEDFTIPSFFYKTENKFANIVNPFADPNFDFDKFISSIRDSNIGMDTVEEKTIDDKSPAESQVNDLENNSKDTIQIKPTKYSKLLMDSVDIRTPRPFRPSSHKKETDKVIKTTTTSEFLNDEYYDIETTKIPKLNKQPILNQESKITYKKKLSDEDYRYGDDNRKQHNHEEVKDNQPISSNHRFTKKDQSRAKYVDNFNITQATQQTSLKPTYTNSVSSKQNRPLTRFNSRPSPDLYEPYKYVTTETPKTASVTVRPKLNRIRTTTERINTNLADSFPVKEGSSRRPTRKGKRPMRLTTTLKTVSFDYDHSDTKDDGRIDSINRVEPSTSAPEQYISARPVNVAAGSRNLYNGSQSYDPQQYDPYYTIYDDDVELYRDVDYGHNYANSNTNSNSNNNQQQQHQHQHQQQQQQQQQQPPRQPQHVYRGTPAPATQNAQIQAETVSQRNPSQYIQTAPAYNPQPPSPADVYQTSSIEDYSEEEDPNQYQSGRQPVRGDRNELNYVAEPPTIRTTTSTTTTSRPIPVSSRSPNTAQVNQTRPQSIFITLSATPRHIPTVQNSDSSSEATIEVDSDREIDLISTTPKLLSRIISLTTAFLFQDKDNKNNNSDTYTTESRPGKITKIPDFAPAAIAIDNNPSLIKDDTTNRQPSNDSITPNKPSSFKITNLPTAENKSVFIQLNTRSLGTSSDILTLNLNNISNTEQTESPNKRDVSNKYDEIDSKGRNTILRSNSTHITPTTYSPPKSFLDSLLQKTSNTFRNIPLISNFRSEYPKSNTNSKSQSQFLDDSYEGNRADNYIPVSVPPQTVSSLSKRVQLNPTISGDSINYRQFTSNNADVINTRPNKTSHRTRLTTTSTEKHPTISIPKYLRPTQKDIYDIDSLVEDISTNDTDEVPFIPKQHNNRYVYDIVESRPSQKFKYSIQETVHVTSNYPKEDSKNETSLIFKDKETGLQENPIRQTDSHYDLEKDVETAILSRGRNVFRFGSTSAEDLNESPVVSRVRFGNAYRPTEKLLDITTIRYSPKYETTTKQIFTQLQNNQEIRPVIIRNNDEISVASRGQFIPVYTQEIKPITQRGRYFTDINTTPAETYIQPTPVIRGHFVTETTPFNTAKNFKTTSSIHVPIDISSTPHTSTDAIFRGSINFETDNISLGYARNNETPTKITIPTDIFPKNNKTKENISNTETVRKNVQSRYTSGLGTSSEKPLNLLYTHRQLNLDLPSTENIWQKIATEKYHNEKTSEQYRLDSSSEKPDVVLERHRIPSRYTTELTLSNENEHYYAPENKFVSSAHPETSEINSFIKKYELNDTTTELPRQFIRVKTVPRNRFTIETNPNHRDVTPYSVESAFEPTEHDESSPSTNNSVSSEKSESGSPQLTNSQNNIFRATVEIPSAPDLTDSHEDSDNSDDVIRLNSTVKPTSNPIPIPSLIFRSGSGSSSPDLTNKTSISNPGRASRVNTAIKSIAMLSGARGTSSKCNTGYNSTIPNTKCNEIQQRTSNTRGRGSAHYTNAGAGESLPVNRGTPPPRSRPTLKPSTSIVSKASEFIDVYKNPPTRPAPVYPQPTPDKAAAKCRKDVCLLPDCSCGGKEIPGDLPVEEVPQIVLLTFDDSVNDLNKGLYSDLFEKGRVNPNGCPITATFYVSHEWTDYSQVQNLYAAGHEIASHTISHSFGEQFSQKKWNREVGGQREILAAYGGVKLEDVRGMRAPFLSVGGNKMFKMLYDSNFTYDSSMPVYENRPPSWPYTLDYKLFHDCMIPPCPTRSYPGVWEVPMVMWQDLNGGRCSMGDACSNPPTAEGVYKMLFKNFERHYTTNRAPFGLFYHAAWFTQPHHKEGFINFLDAINSMKDVYLVTNWQAIQWVRDPTPISRLANFQPFQCNYPNRPKRCNNPKVCNLWHKSGVRYMRTCQPCPDVYPWTGKTGIKSSRIDNDIED